MVGKAKYGGRTVMKRMKREWRGEEWGEMEANDEAKIVVRKLRENGKREVCKDNRCMGTKVKRGAG